MSLFNKFVLVHNWHFIMLCWREWLLASSIIPEILDLDLVSPEIVFITENMFCLMIVFDHVKHVSLCNIQSLLGQPAGWLLECGKIFDIEIFLDTISVNMISVKFCMMVTLIELYLFITLSVAVIVFQGHSCVKSLAANFMFSSGLVENETLCSCWLHQVDHGLYYWLLLLFLHKFQGDKWPVVWKNLIMLAFFQTTLNLEQGL